MDKVLSLQYYFHWFITHLGDAFEGLNKGPSAKQFRLERERRGLLIHLRRILRT